MSDSAKRKRLEKAVAVWYPELDIPNKTLTQLYRSRDKDTAADIIFDVNGKEYHAHKNILSLRAKSIFELTKDNDNEIVPIVDMESDIFESILEFIYCVQKPRIHDEATATKLLIGADRLGCSDLKLYVESTIVDKFLEVSNAANWLVFGDSYSCPLLKEDSMKLYAIDAKAVRKCQDGWSKIRESRRLLDELLEFCTVIPPPKDILSVTALRELLLESNLDIDGNKEILVERFDKQCMNTEKVFVKILYRVEGSKTITLYMKSSDTIENIKFRIKHTEGIPLDKQRLTFNRKLLEDERTVNDYKLRQGSTLILI